MRIVGRIPHPEFSISVFEMNEKFVVKFEAGPMEQTFKFLKEGLSSMESIEALFDEEFINNIRSRFEGMYLDMKRVRNSGSLREG